MFLIIMFLICSVNADGFEEGNYCTKEGVAGVCTNIGVCPAALQDVKNRIEPQICNFLGAEPIVCCVKPITATTSSTTTTTERPNGKCVLPPQPKHGTYSTNVLEARLRDAYDTFIINTTCSHGFIVDGARTVFCQDGLWSAPMPSCVRACHLMPHPSVEYNCIVSYGRVNGTRDCEEFEPHGTLVSPRCRTPSYYSPTLLDYMRCVDGYWDYIATCIPECGTVTPDGAQLVLGGESAKRGEVPWHAGIYTETTQPYKQICGGSLISTNVIISAAHCFWSNVDGKMAASSYAVAVGKLYRPWNNAVDADQAQKSVVKEIHLPARFQGYAANYQDDIAMVIVSVAFEFNTHIRPVCVDFDFNFERRQLQPGKNGKVAGWGLTADNGSASQVLKVIELFYISVETCISDSPAGFREYITSDKICAGVKDAGQALCRGDGGGGLAFPESDKGKPRYYLRGVVSTAPNNEHLCNANYTSFTQVIKHVHFIKEFWRTNL